MSAPPSPDGFTEDERRRYATRIVDDLLQIGPGETLFIETDSDGLPVAAEAARIAYARGADAVHLGVDPLTAIPHPNAVDGTDPRTWDAVVAAGAAVCTINGGAGGLDLGTFPAAAYDEGSVRWAQVYTPTPDWAAAVYPDTADPERALAEDLIRFAHAGPGDGRTAWRAHMDALHARAERCNELDLVALELRGDGTALRIGLLDVSRFRACEWSTSDGERFACNMPTEEVFVTPDPTQAEGSICTSRPIIVQLDAETVEAVTGRAEPMVIHVAALRGHMRGGRLVRDGLEVAAPGDMRLSDEERAECVWRHLTIDEGACALGEVGIVPGDNRVGRTGRLYGVANIDEQAGTHLGFGDSYRQGIEDDADDPRRNRSALHLDLTIGGPAMRIVGVGADGSSTVICADGHWAI